MLGFRVKVYNCSIMFIQYIVHVNQVAGLGKGCLRAGIAPDTGFKGHTLVESVKHISMLLVQNRKY